MTADGFGIELLEAFYLISSRPEGLGKNAGSPVGRRDPVGENPMRSFQIPARFCPGRKRSHG